MLESITLYDIASSLPGQAWSPNTRKIRYALNYKGLPYQTVWVEYPDIESVSKKIGTPPTDNRGGRPLYTFPAIHDPNTNTTLVNSAQIAEYLDSTYPDTPVLFPPGTRALQYAFIDAFVAKLSALWQFTAPQTIKILNPASQEYFRRTREQWSGKKLEDISPTGSAKEEEWNKVRAGFNAVDKWLQAGKEDGPFFLGKEPGFADFVVASYVLWFKKTWGDDSSQWRDIMNWNEGRWAVLIQALEKYETIV